jgi:membrane-associated phospholipid phosphatase
MRKQLLPVTAGCLIVISAVTPASSQTSTPDAPRKGQGFCSSPSDGGDRAVSLQTLLPNILCDQKDIWTFPARLAQGQDIAPTLMTAGSAIGLVALDPVDTPYFRRTMSFHSFNSALSGTNATLAIAAVPISLYAVGFARRDPYAQHSALLIGEAVADTELVATALKDLDQRLRPRDIRPAGNFSDTWFDNKGSWYSSSASFPSGHTIAAFAVATVIAHRYRTHKWIPYAAYGAAALIGFSRVSESAHFPSDVFMGAALGYSITRFVVLP